MYDVYIYIYAYTHHVRRLSLYIYIYAYRSIYIYTLCTYHIIYTHINLQNNNNHNLLYVVVCYLLGSIPSHNKNISKSVII